MLKETYLYLIFNIIAVLLGFVTLPIFTHYLSPEEFGIIAIFYLFGNFLAAFLSFGLMVISSSINALISIPDEPLVL